jgi:hypothetical protein
MSYCRFIEGDVYIFLNTDHFLECCGCILQEREWVDDETKPIIKGYFKAVGEIIETWFSTTEDMLTHLQLHKDKGHYIPQSCIDGLLEDQKENDKIMVAPCGHNYNRFDRTTCAKPDCPWKE